MRFQARQRYLIVAKFPGVTIRLQSVKGGNPEQSIDGLIDALEEQLSRLKKFHAESTVRTATQDGER